jgi:hypothetical protein
VVILNHILDSQYLGFLIMAFCYLLAAFVLYRYREKLIFNRVYKVFLKNEEEVKDE